MTHARRVEVICSLTGLSGAIAIGVAAAASRHPLRNKGEVAFFLVAICVVHLLPLRIWHNGEAENVQLDEAMFVPMALMLSPVELVSVIGFSMAFASLVSRRGAAKTVFNAGQGTTAAAIAVLVTRLLGASIESHATVGSVTAAVIGAFIFTALSAVSVAAVISVAQGTPFRTSVLDGIGIRVATWAGSLCLGVLLAFAIVSHPWLLLVVSVPVIVLQVANAKALGQWRLRQRTEALYAAAVSVQSTIDSGTVRARLLEATKEMLEASEAELIGVDDEAPVGALRAPVGEDYAIVASNRVGGGKWGSHDDTMLRALGSMAAGALKNAELYERLRVVTSSQGEGIFAVDEEGRIAFMNPAAERILGWTESELLRTSLHAAVHRDLHPVVDCPFFKVLSHGRLTRDEDATFARRDGTVLPIACTIAPIERGGDVTGCVVTFRDVTERKAFERQLAHQAFHDTLTGLPNRALFLDRLEHAVVRSRSDESRHALLFADLDRFKLVNDSLGHQAGDHLLNLVAQRLQSCLRAGDTLARFGGDEFTVLLEDVGDSASAMQLAERMLAAMHEPMHLNGRDVHCSISIGVAVAPGRSTKPDELVAFADIAMYRAKGRGGGCADMYDAGAEEIALERLEMEIGLRHALERQELEVHYQPVISLDSGTIVGVEALVRWNHPNRGQILPGEFISLAEETGLILPLGRWVLHEACRQTRVWHDAHSSDAPLMVSVNLSCRQLQRVGLVDDVAEVLRETALRPESLCLEITESAMLEETATTTANLRGLKRLGVRLAIDDFGTGYSSFRYLQRLPVDVVKIDRSFTVGVGEHGLDSEIVTAIVHLARAIGATAVAEGVETAEQLHRLQAVGCAMAQGYHVARPQSRDDVDRLLVDRTAPLAIAT
jgi:diguanylate cyclase (GGDEF)-like protein/PAS domain S-box-containing protein